MADRWPLEVGIAPRVHPLPKRETTGSIFSFFPSPFFFFTSIAASLIGLRWPSCVFFQQDLLSNKTRNQTKSKPKNLKPAIQLTIQPRLQKNPISSHYKINPIKTTIKKTCGRMLLCAPSCLVCRSLTCLVGGGGEEGLLLHCTALT